VEKIGLGRLLGLLLLLRDGYSMVDCAEASDMEEKETRILWLVFNDGRRREIGSVRMVARQRRGGYNKRC
jgi:hypothetical protein